MVIEPEWECDYARASHITMKWKWLCDYARRTVQPNMYIKSGIPTLP